MTRVLLAALLVAACSTPRETKPPHNTAPPSLAIRVGPDEPLGWLGVAPAAARADDDPAWLPVDKTHAALVPAPASGLAAGTTLTAIGDRVARVTVGGTATVPFGCDGNQLDVRVLAGDRFEPGMVWILPPSAPASWQPAAVRIASTSSSPARRTYRAGPLVIALARRGPLQAELAITRDGKALHTQAIERGTEMAGADTPAIDLAEGGPGIPEPVAAWSLAAGGPILVAFVEPTWEGLQIWALLVEEGGARRIDALSHYLYLCAY